MVLAVALADDQFGMRNVEARVEGGSAAVLEAVIGPQGLRTIGHGHRLEGLFAGVGGGERRMTRRMPVLGQHHVLESMGDAIDDVDDFIATRHRQRATGAEIILHVDDQKNVGVLAHGLTSTRQWPRRSP